MCSFYSGITFQKRVVNNPGRNYHKCYEKINIDTSKMTENEKYFNMFSRCRVIEIQHIQNKYCDRFLQIDK